LRLFCLGAIDAQSSEPLVKQDEAKSKKRHASAEKHKSAKGTEKKKEKKKNLEQQALKECSALSRHEWEPEEDSPYEDDENDDDDDDDDDDDSKGMPAHLDQVLQGLPQTDISSSHTGASKRPQGMDRDGHQKEALSCRSCTDTPHATTQGWGALLP
jgi:hypothetical protein